MIKEVVLQIIYQSIDDLNRLNDSEVTKTPETRLFGCDSNIDSLALVNLIVIVEKSVNSLSSKKITIADDKAMSQTRSPFRSVDTLADYITGLVNE